ncbi:hypothetical protein E2C01_037191 [Portunus trituberculatus]|uniref:Uncharacterized protein n=1 Tax=Portunus trituberculatus TaxID=210409 RepID=A0A5B7FAQ8_PORTR|nr:hypothetical protein [Portunus trituberculatus]
MAGGGRVDIQGTIARWRVPLRPKPPSAHQRSSRNYARNFYGCVCVCVCFYIFFFISAFSVPNGPCPYPPLKYKKKLRVGGKETLRPLPTPDNEKTQTTFPEEPLMECDGRLCATGVCVTSQQECDARLDCPDLTDELSTCQLNVTTCLPEDVTVNVTANFTMECREKASQRQQC